MLVKAGVRAILHRAGVINLIRARNRSGLRILMHHRFPAEQKASLVAQCEHIRKHYTPVSMSDVARCLRSGEPLPPNALAITIDDGYRDFYDRASPMFAGFDIPVTMYLVTDFLDGKDWLWMDRIKYAIAHTRKAALEVSLGGQTMRLSLETKGQRDHASHMLREKTKRIANGERLQFIADLPRLTGVEFPQRPPEDMAPLTWDEVRRLDGSGVEFGPHTMSHPILSNLSNPQDVRREIEVSKRRLEAELGHPADHFCYPSGQAVDLSEAAMDSVRDAGFTTAVTSEIGLARRGDDPLTLRRIGVDPGLPECYFSELIAGFAPTLKPESRTVPFHVKVRAAAAVNGAI